jgi:hypothetical protein
MTVKLILLKSGEEIVSDVQEIVNDDDKTIGYYLHKPCIVKIKDIEVEREEDGKDSQNAAKFSIVIYPWIPLTADKFVSIPADWTVTIVEPISKVKNMYNDQVMGIKENDQSIDSDKQSDTDNQN